MRKWTLLIYALLTTAANAQSSTTPIGPAEQFYSELHGISSGESTRRLGIRMEAGRLVSNIIPEFRGRYAGNDFIESPMVVTIRLKGNEQIPSRRFTTEYGPVVIRFSTGATHSIEQLKDVLRSGRLREILPEAGGMGIDIKKGELYANIHDDYTGKAYSAERAEIEQLLGVPVQLRKTRAVTRNLALDPVRAGGRAVNNNNFCTFGFRAYTPAGAPGLITAGHWAVSRSKRNT